MAFANRILHGVKSLFGANETRAVSGSLADPFLLALLGGSPTAAGISVTPETAMRCAPVAGIVKVLSETLAQTPCHLYRKTSTGRERAGDHPLERILSDSANPWTTASEFRLVMQAALSLHGNAYAFCNRGADGQVVELIPLDPRAVTVEPDKATLEPRYILTTDGQRREYSRRDILHIRGVGASPYVGDSPVTLAREAIALSLILETHGSALFGRGARPGGLFEVPGALSDVALARLKASAASNHEGGHNAGKTMVLEGGAKFVPLQLTSVDAQYLELRKFQLQEIARVWRVPLHLLADLERVTHSNAEQMGQQFLTYCILPILRLWQDAIALTCLTPDERREYYVEFLVSDLARADLSGRFAAYSQAINAGLLNPNEIRAMENRGPYPGGEVFTRPVNLAPAPTTAETAP